MSNIVTERFIQCMDKLKEEGRVKSARQFALSLNYLPQSLSEITRGRREVNVELIRKAVERYKINPLYLYTGDGQMFINENGSGDFRVLSIVSDSDSEERIVHVPSSAQNGYAGDEVSPTFMQTLPTFTLPDYKYKSGTHRSFDITEDSMVPTLFEGDKVVCSFLEPNLWETGVKDNYVYVIVTRADVLIRRVKNTLKEENALVLLSDNSFYQTHKINIGDIREVWYVRAKISPFLPSPQNVQNIIRDEVMSLKKAVLQQAEVLEQLQLSIEKLT